MIDRKMAMAENVLAQVMDCLHGLISEQGYEGLRSYTNTPARMLAQLEGAKDLLHDYAYGDSSSAEKPKTPKRNCDKYESQMWAREAFLEEHPFFVESDELHEVIGWLYDKPKRERRRKAPVAAPAGADV